jgi:rubredoxin
MQLANVATFNSDPPAQALRKRLEQAGLKTCVVNEERLQRLWFLSRPFASVHVRVPTEDADAAASLVTKWDAEDGVLREAIRCPECGSSRVEYPQMTRYFILPTIINHVMTMFGILPHECYCRNCQYTWRPKGFPRRTRPGRKNVRHGLAS